MERIDGINLERIMWCCTEYGIALDELASKLRISESSINRLKSGEASLTFNQLRKIGDYFGRGALFFLEPGEVNGDNLYSPQFRSISNKKETISREVKLLIERAENQRQIYLDLIKQMGEVKVDFQPPDVGSDISNAAAIARRWALTGTEDSFDAYRSAVEDKGILVFRSNGYKGKWHIPKDDPILGFSLHYDTCPVIFVRKQDAPARQTFTLAHELGHILLHRDSNIDDRGDLSQIFFHREGRMGGKDGYNPRKNDWEAEANAFAGIFLVPDDHLDLIDKSMRPNSVTKYEEWLKPYVREWGVSYEVILRRLMDSSRLDRELYNEYRKWKQTRLREEKKGGGGARYRHLEPKQIFGRKYVGTILNSLNAGHITFNKASQYLDNLKISDIELLEKSYVDV